MSILGMTMMWLVFLIIVAKLEHYVEIVFDKKKIIR